jgi:hypothetical protein
MRWTISMVTAMIRALRTYKRCMDTVTMRKRGSQGTLSRHGCVTSIRILRSGMRRKSHAPFWSSGRRSARLPTVAGRTSRSASMSPRSGDGSTRCAYTRRAYGSSWYCARSIIISACVTPAYTSCCRSLCRLTGRAQPGNGGRVHQRGPLV